LSGGAKESLLSFADTVRDFEGAFDGAGEESRFRRDMSAEIWIDMLAEARR